jgi:hypothetical protein
MTFTEHQRAPRIMNWIMLGAGAMSLGFIIFTAALLALDGQAAFVLDELLIPVGLHVVIFGFVWVVMWRSTLHIDITAEGVQIRFTPFHRKPRTFAWGDVERIIVRKVSPFGEFGGWGIRWNFSKITGYVWRGKTGIDLRMRDGRRVVITIEDIATASDVIHAVVPTGVEYEQRIPTLKH